jgi:hypothetical protein
VFNSINVCACMYVTMMEVCIWGVNFVERLETCQSLSTDK